MAEYTYKDVIIDPCDPRVEIGMKYYRADFPKRVLSIANNDEDYFGTLESIDTESPETPFVVKTGSAYSAWACLIRKKEPSYAERQARWLAENCIKKGDKVRIIRKAESREDGWQTLWNPDMDETVGKVGTVSHISANFRECGIDVDVPDVGEFLYPYFVLEKVEQKYVPFNLSKEEDRAKLRGAWIRIKGQPQFEDLISAMDSCHVFIGSLPEGISPSDLFTSYEFADGTLCGKLEVVEE